MSAKGSGNNTNNSNRGGGGGPTRTGPSYEETVVHGKKRKVWRSHHSNTSNMMSPEAAANYLQQAAEAAAAAAGGGGESVQITLGPNGIAATTTTTTGVASSVNMESLQWMNPNYTGGGPRTGSAGGNSNSNNPLAGMGVNMNMSMNLNTNSVSFGGLDLAALAKAGDLSALTNAAARNVAATNASLGISTTTPAIPSIATTADAAAIDASIARKLAPAGTAHIPTGSSKSLAGASIPGGGGGGKDSLPCSEAEMKALMSMFVEIMGMSMNTEKLGASSAAKKRAAKAKKNGEINTSTSSTSSSSDGILDPGSFSFGSGDGSWPDPAIAAATGDLDALNAHRYAYSDDEDEDEDDSLPGLDDMAEVQKQRQASGADKHNDSAVKVKSGAALLPTNTNPTPITGRSGIAPVAWESLEQVAIEDAMEAEERARKAAKRREKKNRKKEKARKEAAAKAAEEASKKQEKIIIAWRSRVVVACQSNEVEKLVALLEESPLTLLNNTNGMSAAVGVDADAAPIMTIATIIPHLEFLLPHTVAKNRASAERGNDARTKLAHFLMNTYLPMVFTTPLRTGRTAMHTACLHGELDFVQHALTLAKIWEAQQGESNLAAVLPPNYLQLSCQESGFAPIHYAVLSGVKPVLEALLEAGADVKLKSSDTHTWKSRYVQ